MDTYCALSGCHNASSREAGVDLSTYAKTKNAFETTSCLCTIHHGSGCSPMPKGGSKLSDATIKLIDCWAKMAIRNKFSDQCHQLSVVLLKSIS